GGLWVLQCGLVDPGHPAHLGRPRAVRPVHADDHDLPVHGVRHRQLLHWIRDGILSIRHIPVHGVPPRLLLHWIRGRFLYWMRHFSVHGVRHRLLLHWIRDGILWIRHLPVHGVRHRQLLHWIRDGILSGGSLRGWHQRRQLLHHELGLHGWVVLRGHATLSDLRGRPVPRRLQRRQRVYFARHAHGPAVAHQPGLPSGRGIAVHRCSGHPLPAHHRHGDEDRRGR